MASSKSNQNLRGNASKTELDLQKICSPFHSACLNATQRSLYNNKGLHLNFIGVERRAVVATEDAKAGKPRGARFTVVKIVEIVDLIKLFEKTVFKFKDDSFIYLTYTLPKSSELFTPYSLKQVPFSEVDENQFYTVSRHGVTFWSPSENHFTKLSVWLAEYEVYQSLMKIRLFRLFRIWKQFKIWRVNIKWRKFMTAQNVLEESLFIVIPPLALTLIELNTHLLDLRELKLLDCHNIQNWALDEFIETQMATYEKTRDILSAFRDTMKSLLFQACYKSMIYNNFSPIDEIELYASVKKMKDNMSFIDRTRKRRFCILLGKFLNCCDFMTINALHKILTTTFQEFANMFELHEFCAPSMEVLGEILEMDKEMEEERPPDYPKTPFLVVSLVLQPKFIEMEPPRAVVIEEFRKLVLLIRTTVFGFKRFQSDLFYKQFTKPSIMGRQEDRLCGEPANIDFQFGIDHQFQYNNTIVFEILEKAYDRAELYIERFEKIRIDYEQDMETDPKEITAVTDVATLREFCERYVNEMANLQGILPDINIGLLKLQQNTFKETIIPVCRHLVRVLENHMPRLAIECVAQTQEKLEEVLIKILNTPDDTMSYVNYLRYTEQCMNLIDSIDGEFKYSYELFVLMKEFQVPVDVIEKEKYLDVEDYLGQVKDTLNDKLAARDEFVQNLAQLLQLDIRQVFDDVQDVMEKSVEEWLILEESNRQTVKDTLQGYLDRLAVSQSLSQDYRKFQREFRIDVTRFDMLELAFQEVRNRQLLWASVEEWYEIKEDVSECNFHHIDVEELTATNTKILKNCTVLEKYLPPNTAIQKLRVSAEDFKEKIPTIGYLRNPSIKLRHWIKIEQILNRKLITDDHLTLNTLESVNAFEPDIAYEIMEVSGQASAEAGLEVLLKKVEKSWLEFEIPVVSHRDAKDIFIIAGLDDIQMNLDDSNININTIAASRHVGPIKPRVDEWMKTLELFAETFDEWVSCQQSWMYLEVIFSAPDIQRQLPNESRMFMSVDKSWKEIMRKTQKLPLALPAMTEPGLLAKFKHNNSLLDTILKSIEVYLEIKRVAFPRFYFLSNEELLEVLAQTRNPHAIQPHLRKCFDAIARIEFGLIKGRDGQPDVATTDILAMLSPEGESVQFGKGLKARGSVEDWLSKVEESMVVSLRRCMKHAFLCYHNKDRSEWFQDHANQVVLTVAQQQWATNVHVIMDSGDNTQIILDKVKAFERECTSDLSKLAAIARTSIPKLLRSVLCALITIDVHAKDTITNLVNQKVTKSSDFNWLKMLRYYWVPSSETMEAKMSTSTLPYFYEYLGAGGVLVITPLTDRCYLCLMGALQMDLGGSPAGPAGTGKTETTKDLAKAVAKQCVVFNCSDGLDYKMMGRFFSGLAQSGAWCCFDEFNRIDIEVLSVIAQQLITIRTAKAMKMKRFMFEGREIKLNLTCAAFITMNPGYAGRTELPDNLKALFRPVAMMVPDYALIAEVILYSEGFENSRVLAQKMVQMYKLCSEQLSQQDHYDFGMRAVKSVLVMAGALKRENPNQVEDITLIAALRDANLPKFLAADAKLFRGILTDLFPGVDLPVAIYGELQKAIAIVMEERNLQAVPEMIVKTIQLYETMCVRWGVMLVGLSGSGKTTVLHTLANALTKLEVDAVPGPLYRRVRTQTLNPKSITLDELYGAVNLQTLEWSDGLLGIAIRSAVNVTAEEHQWVVCDGPVDAVWIENMNTVLDDNKMLCLANSERIKLTPWVHLVFEVQDLAQASPATVSRCGMVYCDPGELGWQPIVRSWQATIKQLDQELNDYIFSLFLKYLDDILTFGRKTCTYSIHQVEISKIIMLCTIYYALIRECKGLNFMERDESKLILKKLFIWCALWSIGGNFGDDSRVKIEEFIKTILPDDLDNFPSESLWNYRFNTTTKEWENWNELVPEFKYNPEIPYFDMIVSTADTAKYSFVANLLFQNNKAVMFTGETGVGKSILAKEILSQLSQINVITVTLNFSAQTSSLRTQETIESRLDRRKKTLLGPPIGKRILFFIDDINMPELDTYGSQPPIELLRQLLDFNGLFDREKLFWKDYIDVLMGAACAPPGGGRNVLTARFVRHFSLLQLPLPSTLTLYTIFSSIMSGFLNDFNAEIRPLAEPMVRAAISIYSRIEKELLPTPTKSHYVFNLRDLSKFVQGILQADGSNYGSRAQMLRLFYHESMRVFHDRLINETDKTFYKDLMKDVCLDHFETPIVTPDEVLFFGDFMIFGQAKVDRIYEEIKNMEKLLSILMDYMDDYNSTTGKTTNLILFQDAIEHITRLARLLRSERGNGLLIGLSGMGKQSLSRIGAHINGYMCAQIELCRGYNRTNFHEDLRKMCYIAGATNQPTVFLITDTQIIREDFLEDINNILNSGEVPNLFESDEYEKVILGTRQACISARSECTRDDIFDYFVGRVRANLHLVICMSPIGDAFRRRCRMFPSLVNCCTIDWFVKWPREALYSVALGALKEIDNATVKQYSADLANTCVMMHEMVEVTSERFYNEARRYYYTTPSSYLELLKLYKILLKKREDAIAAKRTRIGNGLSKLLESNELVAVMGEELKSFAPIIEKKAASMKELLIKLDVDTQAANVVRTNVSRDEAEAMIKKNETMAISEDAARDLETAMPALRSAQDALKALNKTDVNELRSFQVPPALVQFVMEPVCILLGAKTNWAAAKQLMSDTNFLKKLVEFDKEHISEKTIARLQTYVDHKDFQPDVIEKVSKVCKSMCLWVKAMVEFAKVYKVVEPKVQRHAAAERELKEVMQVLKQKQSELAQIEAKIQSLKDSIDINNQEFMILQQTADLTAARLNRAGRLTSALSDEEIRWKNTVGAMTVELWAIPGDSLVSAACVAYLGAFPISYRVTLAEKWSAECRRLEIPSSESFNLTTILGEPYQLRQWNLFGLPRDDMSLENGIIVMNANRWPLMIDPQEQANRWIRNMEKENELRIMKITDPNLLKLLEICIRQGLPLLIEEIGETIDPTLGPVLSRSVTSQAGRLLIKLGDTDVDYDPRFKLYMTTKLSNPHYLPEICIQITLVNFLVTHSGLEDQLLAEIVAIELPELEKQRSDLVFKINADKQQLLALEDKVLKLLFNSQGNILDDEELVETLNEAKETSAIIAARLIDTEQTEAVITVKREKYRALATRGANLYFVVTNLAEIDSMYQNSLKYFTKIFSSVIALNTEVSANLEQRLNMLMEAETYSIYQNVSRGLFEKHKLVFSFMLAIAVELEMGHLSSDDYQLLLRGPVDTGQSVPKRPDISALSNDQWKNCVLVEEVLANSKGISQELNKTIDLTLGEFTFSVVFVPNAKPSPTNWTKRLTIFERLIIISILRREKFSAACTAYVCATIGRKFTEIPRNNTLSALYTETSNTTPLVFVLSTGSDPMSALLKFSQTLNVSEKLFTISLGQGQGPAAQTLIEKGRITGLWIFLQNCHLATSWMPVMEKIIRDISLGVITAHNDFRLFLSSVPTKSFPVSVLQNSLKLTNEPPKGLRTNLIRTMGEMDKDYFEKHILEDKWRTMVFGICIFHAVVLERRKFGPLGWNIYYDFADSDRECGLKVLDMYCDREERNEIPWDSLGYINGEITWGGRVTDYWDQRCLKTILKTFLSERVLKHDYKYSESGIYRAPSGGLEVYQTYIQTLPLYDDPDIFGMHPNANIVFETNETNFFIGTLLEMSSTVSSKPSDSGAVTLSDDDICLAKIQLISDALTRKILVDKILPSLIATDAKGRVPSLTTVLLQELDRFNNLLVVVHKSLGELKKAIKGLIVMSESLEGIFGAFLINQVPKLWATKGFLSTKSLANWVIDFQYRIDFIQTWVLQGLPRSTWLSGLYFPQSFLTGILQRHARQYNLPIDLLKIDFEVMAQTVLQSDIYQKHKAGQPESKAIYLGVDYPIEGGYVHGLFIEGGQWDGANGGLSDSSYGELMANLPVMWLKPCLVVEPRGRYDAPMYKTQIRAGVLSTTGHSTNFVVSVWLPSRKERDYWILKGTALITMTTE